MKGKVFLIVLIFLVILAIIGFIVINNSKNVDDGNSTRNETGGNVMQIEYQEENRNNNDISSNKDVLLYQGKASIRIITREGKVIYIDPFMGNGYDMPADLILVTHEHFDHNNIDKVKNRNEDCKIIRNKDAVINGVHQIFDLGYAKIEAVEAGYNSWHDVNECVGYIVTLSSGISIYVTGDTSTTRQMPELAEKNIDYAFFCCDGIYNMGLDEAIDVANMVKAKHSIPYHMTGSTTNDFDKNKAEHFNVDGKMIIETGEEIVLEKSITMEGGENQDNKMESIENNASKNEEDVVLKRYKEMQQAMIDKDIKKLDEIVKDGTTFTHMSGKVQTKEEYFSDIEQGLLNYKKYTIENPNVTINENKATLSAKKCIIKPAVHQIETHPFYPEHDLKALGEKYGTIVESWFPLGGIENKGKLLDNDIIKEIAKSHGKTTAQVILRWHIQNDYVAIPGSADEKEIAENFDIFDFELTDEDLEKMQRLDTATRFFTMSEEEQEKAFTGFAPDFNNQK